MAQPTVVLMSGGFNITNNLNAGGTGTRVFWDAAARPDLTGVSLPEVGDAWDLVNDLLIVQSIVQTPIGEDTTAGYQYICNYSTENGVKWDWLADDTKTSVSVTTGAEFNSYTIDPTQGDTLYVYDPATQAYTAETAAQVNGKMSPIQSVTVTKRYRDSSITDLLADDAAVVGCINGSGMWGFGVGTILYMGMSATPIKEYDNINKNTAIHWNISYNYQLRSLPGIDADTWQYVFYKGQYVRLSESEESGGFEAYDKYVYGGIPNPLA